MPGATRTPDVEGLAIRDHLHRPVTSMRLGESGPPRRVRAEWSVLLEPGPGSSPQPRVLRLKLSHLLFQARDDAADFFR